MWLYGTEGGSHWPKAEVFSSNYATRQLYNRELKLTKDTMEPHALECVEFARAIVEGRPRPYPPNSRCKYVDPRRHLPQPARGQEVAIEAVSRGASERQCVEHKVQRRSFDWTSCIPTFMSSRPLTVRSPLSS